MAFIYKTLSDAEKRGMIEARLKQYESDHYQHSLNIRSIEADTSLTPEETAAQVAVSTDAMNTLEVAIMTGRTEANAFPAVDPATPVFSGT